MKLSENSYWQSFLLSGGTILNSFLGLIFYVLVARNLGVENFGRFSFVIGLGLLAAELGDFGFGSVLVKFGSKRDFSRIFSLAFVERIVAATVILIIFLPWEIWAAGVGISLLFVSLMTQGFLARQKYTSYIGINLLGNITRLLIFPFFPPVVVFSFGNAVAFFAGLIFHGEKFNFKNLKEDFFKVFIYSRWLALSYGVTSLAAKIDIPLLYLLGGAQITGIYSSAQKLLSVFSQLAGSLEGVFAPKLSAPENKTPLKEYFLITGIVAILTLILIPFSGFIIPVILGAKYNGAIPVFNLLLIGIVFFYLAGPFTAVVLYQKGKSAYHLIGSVIQLVINVSLFLVLIPNFGIWGAVVTFIFSQFFNFGYYLFVWQYVRNRS